MSSEVIDLSNVRRDRALDAFIKSAFAPFDIKPSLDLAAAFQQVAVAMLSYYFAAINPPELQKPRTLMLQDFAEGIGYAPLVRLGTQNGSHVLASYTSADIKQNGTFSPKRMEFRIDVANDGERIGFYHGDTRGTGHSIHIRRINAQAYIFESYKEWIEGRPAPQISPDKDHNYMASMLFGMVGAMNRSETQKRDRLARLSADSAHAAGAGVNIRLVI